MKILIYGLGHIGGSLALGIKKYCKKEKKVSLCIKNLQEKRSDLQKGKMIEIPVAPFKR